MRHLYTRWTLLLASSTTLLFGGNSFGAVIDLQGVNKGTTNYFGGPLNGWQELEFIPCRVVINNAGSNQVVVSFNNNANGKPGIQNLFSFTPSTNAGISTPVLTGSSALQDWYYTFSAFVTNPPAYVYYQSRMAAGSHLFGGASLHMFNPQLQLAKAIPAAGTPDLVITKTGPATIMAGQTLMYTIAFSNKLTAANASIGNEIYDSLPTGMTYANNWSGTAGVTFFQALGNELWWDLPDLQPGDSGTLTYQVIVAGNVPNGTVLRNNAQILSTQNDGNMADNVSIVTTTVTNIVPPISIADSYSTSRNQTLTVGAPGVLSNDSDPNNATLKAYVVTNVTAGTLTLNTNGSFNYVPAGNFSGTVYFYYIASNSNSSSQPTKVSINVFYFGAPADANLSCASAVPTGATNLAQFLAQGGVDGGPYCGQPTVVNSVTDISNGGAGCVASPLVITRTYKLTTGCGDVTNVVQTITVIDSSAPVISAFPPDATYSCAGQVPSANDSLVAANDNCSSITITHNADVVISSNCVNRFILSRTYVATDACGNSSSRTQTIAVNGTTPPTMTAFPADATYACAGVVPAANDSLVTAANACGGSSGIIVSHSADSIVSGNCLDRFTIKRTYTATDGCGNTSSQTQTIVVDGTTAPTITTFPADSSYSCAASVPAADDALVAATSACGGSSGVVITHNPDFISSSNCVNRFTVGRIYVATDACGNSTSKTQTITVNGTTPPTIATFPSDLTVGCASAIPAPDDSQVVATDGCGSGTVTISHTVDSVSSSNCVSRFTVTRTYFATDACGNSSSRSQTITVNSITAPTITLFPADVTVSCPSAVPQIDDSLVAATDHCGTSSPVMITHDVDVIGASNCVGRFTITRTYRASDLCGNVTSKSQTITVNATTAPTISGFPADATYSCVSAVSAANDSLVTAIDGCGGSSGITIGHLADAISASNCVSRLTITRTYIASDTCGNSASKIQTITVNATNAPAITGFPTDATYACAGAVPAADDTLVTAADSCASGSVVAISHDADVITSSNCVNRFVIMRTYHATDSCGNVATRSQAITVSATAAPVITVFPNDATYACASAVPAANDSLVAAVDNCSGNSSAFITHNVDEVTPGICANRFSIARTYVATDACGNSSSKTQMITVNQTMPPTIVAFPVDTTYSCANMVPAPNDSLVAATDGCGANSVAITHSIDVISSSNCVSRFTITRTYIATDTCGNSASKSQTITVNGTAAPTITAFPADATYSCASAVPAANNSLLTAVDNCGTSAPVAISHDADIVSSSNCMSKFIITRTYHATDACGNSASKSQTITVNGVVPPTIIGFPADETYACAGSVPAANDSLVSATNACGGNLGVVITHDADLISASNCVNHFTITRTYIATDACGNSASRSQTITINGAIPPTITGFPADATYACAGSVPPANDSSVNATNACGGNAGVVISHLADSISGSNCLNRFTLIRTYIATDACGNSTSKNQTITVNSTAPPTITTFPADASYSCAGLVPAANDSLVVATDNCGSALVVISHSSDTIASSNCVGRFTITRTYRATDGCGNVTTRNQTIVVNDTIPPTISCPPSVTVMLPSDIPSPNPGAVTASDNCSGVQTSFISDSNATNSYSVTITRTYAATDDCGNSSTCTQTITFNPQLAKPTANPDSYSVLENKSLTVNASGVLFNDTDPNSLPLQAVLETATTNGILALNGNGGFQYTPNTDYFGPDTFTYRTSNGGTNASTPVNVSINVVFVNQPPSFNKGNDVSILEDAAATQIANWATNIKPGPANESDQVLNFSVSNDNSNLFTVQPSVSTNGDLTFATTPFLFGSAAVTVLLHDNGGTANGGSDTSAPQTFTITVLPVNHAPSFTKGTNQIVNNYAPAQTRLNWATDISPGPPNESTQKLNFTVTVDNPAIFSSMPAISTNGTLTFAPADNKYGDAKVTVTLHDDGGTANGGHDTSASQTAMITVNNPPVISIITPTNTSSFLYPSPVTIVANAFDLDGFVTNVSFLNGTSVIGQAVLDNEDNFTMSWTNAPATNCVLYAIATDNYGATNVSSPVNIQLGNPVIVAGGPIAFSPSLFSWAQRLSVTNPTISTVQSIKVTFTSISAGVGILGITGTNSLGQPYIVYNNTVGPATSVVNYATILYVASAQPVVTFTTSASLTPGPTFSVNATNLVKITRHQFQADGSFLLNFMSSTNKTYYVQYTYDTKSWLTSPMPLKGNGTQMQWLDFGPGLTECTPRSAQLRFYRVVAP